jgi:hypothetical protein
MARLTLFILFTLTGCSAISYFEKESGEFHDEFTEKSGVDSRMKVLFYKKIPYDKNWGDHVVGLCPDGGVGRNIKIKKMYYWMASPITRKALIFHELGHCVLHKKHNKELMKDECPKSLMYPEMSGLTEKCLNKHWEEYEEELFQKKGIAK